MAWALLACFCDSGLFLPLYGTFAQVLPWYHLSARVTRPAFSSSSRTPQAADRLLLGTGGLAGEIGHVIVAQAGRVCRCGNRGCLETVASPVAIARLLQDSWGRAVTPDDLSLLLAGKSTGALRVVEDAAEAVGRTLAGMVTLFNPQMIVIGGDLAVAGDRITGPISRTIARYALPSVVVETPRSDDLLRVPGRPGPADAARDRRAGRQSRQGRRRLAPVKRNRFIALDGATKSANRELEAKAKDLAGLMGYITNLAACPDGTPVTAEFVIGELPRAVEHREVVPVSKSDLRARPIYPRKRDSIDAHLTIVFAALAVTRLIEHRTG